MVTGITYGTFDVFHIGHLNLLERIRQKCDYLIVAVSTDEFNKIKGKISFQEYSARARIIDALSCVNEVIPEKTWDQKRNDISNLNINKFFMGSDWTGKFDDLKDIVEVVYLDRTPDVSSSELRLYFSSTMKNALKDISKAGEELERCIKVFC